MENLNKIELAKRIASYGFPIIRVRPDSKEPLGGTSFIEDSTTDIDVIDFWFSEDPDINYGVMGGDTGFIIDLDLKPDKDIDGLDTLISIEIEEGDTSNPLHERSFRVNSPRGGLHIYLRNDSPIGNAHNFPRDGGIDIRGKHGYVVGPGCTFNGKLYTPQNDISEVQYPPDWLVGKYLKKPGEKDKNSTDPILEFDLPENIVKAEHFLKNEPPAIEGQNGSDHTYRVSEEVRDIGISETKCLDLLMNSGWNDRCEPPWDMNELEIHVHNAYKYGQNRPGNKADFMSIYEARMTIETQEQINVGVGDGSLDDHLFTPKAFKRRGKRRDYIIPEWLISHGFTAINAKRSMGKSTILLDLACCIACGMDWQGTPIKEGYMAVYLCGEDDEGLELNVNAWEKYNGVEIPDDNMIFSDRITNLMSAEDTEKWAKAIKEKIGDKKAVVIMDTWQRASSHAGQNSDEDMQKCVAHAEALARVLGGPALVAFHPPKHSENTIHGSAIIENSTTAIWKLEETTIGRKLSVTRIKGPGEGNYKLFKFEQVELDEKDSFGNNRKGLVPHFVGGTEDANSVEGRAKLVETTNAWGEAVFGILEKILTMSHENQVKNKPYIDKVARLLEEYSVDPEFQNDHLISLTNLGITSLTYRPVRDELTRIFKQGSAPVVLSNGRVISLIPDGKNKRIFHASVEQAV